ncbi:hypothetical protein [Alkalicella caledoniensis]|nr:hypothetical protein [Alkalicella caledoniensis]
MREENQISRKKFLKGVGATVASVAVVGTIGSVLAGCSSEASADVEKAQWPYPYQKVDSAEAEKIAYKGYKEKGG